MRGEPGICTAAPEPRPAHGSILRAGSAVVGDVRGGAGRVAELAERKFPKDVRKFPEEKQSGLVCSATPQALNLPNGTVVTGIPTIIGIPFVVYDSCFRHCVEPPRIAISDCV